MTIDIQGVYYLNNISTKPVHPMGPRKKSKPNSKVKGQARSSATDQTSKKSDREAPEGLTTSKVEENEGQNCDFEPEVVSVVSDFNQSLCR